MKHPALLLAGLLLAGTGLATETSLSSLDLSKIKQGWGVAQRDQAVTEKPMSIGGTAFSSGIGTHAPAMIVVELDGQATSLYTRVGVDDNAGAGKGSVVFRVITDGKTRWQSQPMKAGQPPVEIDMSLKGARQLLLIASDAGDGRDHDHANWGDARITHDGAAPVIAALPEEKAVILTPPAPAAPRINGPLVYGCGPGHPFIYRVPCTGERPMTFSAEGLPEGLTLDAAKGIITGTAPARGEYAVTLRAKNEKGEASRAFKIVAGDTISLTPQMGYNHWYTHYNRITQAMMEEAADILVSSGMADAGYQFVSVDDCWMNARGVSKYQTDPTRVGPVRDDKGNIVPNKHFPDMKGMADYIHAHGLKAGIYTSPGDSTCAGFGGALGFEENDARQFAEWGYDLLKYDWCSYGRAAGKNPDLDAMKKPYVLMGGLLKKQPRDIVFNLCQYGMGDVWKWGREIGGHSWRTGGDLGFELNRIFEIAVRNCELREFNGPGGFNDPDYLQIGWVGAQRDGKFEMSQPCPLTPNEQYSFMSLWCLMSSPLFYSGDVHRLDPFTLNILCNHELIEINQDPLAQCARVAARDGDGFVLVKELADGNRAIGLANTNPWPVRMTVTWEQAGLKGKQIVRDCWRQKDLGAFDESFVVDVPPRFVFTVRTRGE
jgi:alpha-galactosidase